jgi:flagella basal body P-ring formation protein FlgA
MRTMDTPAFARARAPGRHLAAALWLALGLASGSHAAPPPIDAALATALQHQAEDRARAAWGAQPLLRVEVTLGRLDPRLQLAACDRIEPFVPPGSPPWGATRVGLRCAQGQVGWKVTLPATVQMLVRGLVVPAGLPAGQTIAAAQLAVAEVDAASRADAVLTDPAQAVGRVLARAVAAGEPLRRNDLRSRQWFAAGEMVRIVASGAGWTVSAEGRAIGPGIEGQPVSARTPTGQTVTGYATGDHRLELPL